MTPRQLNALKHYNELARRKSTPNKAFAAGIDSALHGDFEELVKLGYAEKLLTVAVSNARTEYFRITQAGRDFLANPNIGAVTNELESST